MYASMNVCTHVCMRVWVCVCMHVRMYVCLCVRGYVYVSGVAYDRSPVVKRATSVWLLALLCGSLTSSDPSMTSPPEREQRELGGSQAMTVASSLALRCVCVCVCVCVH